MTIDSAVRPTAAGFLLMDFSQSLTSSASRIWRMKLTISSGRADLSPPRIFIFCPSTPAYREREGEGGKGREQERNRKRRIKVERERGREIRR